MTTSNLATVDGSATDLWVQGANSADRDPNFTAVAAKERVNRMA